MRAYGLKWIAVAGCAVLLGCGGPTERQGSERGVVTSSGVAADVVTRTNTFRQMNTLGTLRRSVTLDWMAARHASDMRINGVLSHRGSDGSDIAGRAEQQGYRYCLLAENIAEGQSSARQVMQDWINSPGHRANLMAMGVTEIGVAQDGRYWVMVLARPC